MLQKTKPLIILLISLIYTLNTMIITAYIFRAWEEDPTIVSLKNQNPTHLFTYLAISTILATAGYWTTIRRTLNNQSRT